MKKSYATWSRGITIYVPYGLVKLHNELWKMYRDYFQLNKHLDVDDCPHLPYVSSFFPAFFCLFIYFFLIFFPFFREVRTLVYEVE